MVDKELVNYIQETSSSGFSHDQIRQTLADAGWLPHEIEDAFASIPEPRGTNSAPAHKAMLPQDRGFFARHQKALVAILAFIILLPLVVYGAKWGYDKFTAAENIEKKLPSAAVTNVPEPTASPAEMRKRDLRRLEDIAGLQAALEAYFAVNQVYPDSLTILEATDQLTTIPRDPKTGDAYLYSPLSDPAIHYSLSFVLEGSVGSLAAGLHNVSSETSLSADFAKKEESAIRGEITTLSNTLVVTDLSALPFYPAEEVSLSVMPLPEAEFVNAFLIIDNMKLVDRKAPFGFSFSAPRSAGEYPVQVFAFDRAGNGYTQTTRLIVKAR